MDLKTALGSVDFESALTIFFSGVGFTVLIVFACLASLVILTLCAHLSVIYEERRERKKQKELTNESTSS